jgi:hypothetical protein
MLSEWKIVGGIVVWIATHAIALATAWYEIKNQAQRAETNAKSALTIASRLDKTVATKTDLLAAKERDDAIERRIDRENATLYVRLSDIQTQLAEIRSLILNNAKK